MGHETNPYQAPSPGGSESPPHSFGPYQSLEPLVRTLVPWLWLSAAGEALGLAFAFIRHYTALFSELVSPIVVWGLLVPRLGPFFVSAIFFARFLYRSNVNCRALGLSSLSYSPAAMVFWHFVPFAHLVVPYLAVREVFFASQADDGVVALPKRFFLWWVCWAGSSVTGYLGAVFAAGSMPGLSLGLAASLSFIASAILAVNVVRTLAELQTAAAAALGLG